MEIFILTLLALAIFFWFLKKESQKNDEYFLNQLRSNNPNTQQQIMNDFYRDVQNSLDKVVKELESVKKSQMQILKEHANIMTIIHGQAGMETPKPYFTTKKKPSLKIVKLKQTKKNEDKNGKYKNTNNGKNEKDD